MTRRESRFAPRPRYPAAAPGLNERRKPSARSTHDEPHRRVRAAARRADSVRDPDGPARPKLPPPTRLSSATTARVATTTWTRKAGST